MNGRLNMLVLGSIVLGLFSIWSAECSNMSSLEKYKNYYDRFIGDKVDEEHLRQYKASYVVPNCTIIVKPCGPHEGSRVDGTCNNYKHPSRGSAMGPYLRLLKPDYPHDFGIRRDQNGNALPSARKVRTSLQSSGIVVDKHALNIAGTQIAGFVAIDASLLTGIDDYIKIRQYCCKEEGEDDPRCIPVYVPEDDPLYRLGKINCLNFSRAFTFQNGECLSKTVAPEQVNFQTPMLDLSLIYGVNEEALASIREGYDGLLKMEVRNGRHVPLGDAGREHCIKNRPNETICYRFGSTGPGAFDLRLTEFMVFFYREHNRVAEILKDLNPCWKDDRLFKVARQINIGTLQNMFLYEFMPIIMGQKHMIDYGLISDRVEHVKGYGESSVPLVYTEFDIALRFLHTLIDGRVKMYKENYRYSGAFSISDTLYRSALLEENKNFEEINRGVFHQPAGKMDDVADPEISEKFFGELQKASDLIALDIQRGRDLGLRGYNDYRHLCGMKTAKKFEDFADVMDYEKLEILQGLYHDIDDIDLLAGIMSERFIEGSHVGPTFFCIAVKQILLWRYADRFWFERGDNFHSFTLTQLEEIRKTNMARFACDNAEGVKYLQPHAMRNMGPNNEPVPCSQIQGPDFSKWKDNSCFQHQDDDGHGHLQAASKPFSKYFNN